MHLRPEVSPIDGALHSQNLAILDGVSNSATLDQLRTRCPGIFDSTDLYFYRAPSQTAPFTAYVADVENRALLVCLAGMTNFDKAAQCLTGWSNPLASADGSLYPFETGARDLVHFLPADANGRPWNSIRIIGHSYGGAVAPYLMKWMLGIGSETLLECFTYGAPKLCVSTSSLSTRLKQACRRVFLPLDPVPLLPLSSENMTNLWTLVGVPTARAWSRWMQPISGLVITDASQMAASNNPSYQHSYTVYFTLAGWLAGTDAFGAVQHSLASYIRAAAGVPAVLQVNPNPTTQTTGRGHTVPTTVQLNEQRDVALVTAGEVIAQNPQRTVVGIASGVPLVHGERFHGTTQSGRNVVVYNGNVVAWPTTRRLRRALVRDLNRTVAIG